MQTKKSTKLLLALNAATLKESKLLLVATTAVRTVENGLAPVEDREFELNVIVSSGKTVKNDTRGRLRKMPSTAEPLMREAAVAANKRVGPPIVQLLTDVAEIEKDALPTFSANASKGA